MYFLKASVLLLATIAIAAAQNDFGGRQPYGKFRPGRGYGGGDAGNGGGSGSVAGSVAGSASGSASGSVAASVAGSVSVSGSDDNSGTGGNVDSGYSDKSYAVQKSYTSVSQSYTPDNNQNGDCGYDQQQQRPARVPRRRQNRGRAQTKLVPVSTYSTLPAVLLAFPSVTSQSYGVIPQYYNDDDDFDDDYYDDGYDNNRRNGYYGNNNDQNKSVRTKVVKTSVVDNQQGYDGTPSNYGGNYGGNYNGNQGQRPNYGRPNSGSGPAAASFSKSASFAAASSSATSATASATGPSTRPGGSSPTGTTF